MGKKKGTLKNDHVDVVLLVVEGQFMDCALYMNGESRKNRAARGVHDDYFLSLSFFAPDSLSANYITQTHTHLPDPDVVPLRASGTDERGPRRGHLRRYPSRVIPG